jgi:hypothetical protein
MMSSAMQRPRDFAGFSRSVVEQFLNTIVVVDDRAKFGASGPLRAPGPLTSPGRQGAPKEEPVSPEQPEDRPHDLDAKLVINSFAERGIVCAVLKPDSQNIEHYQNQFQQASRNADAIVLDWVLLDYDEGQKALELIKSLAAVTRGERFRLILIYTGEKNLNGIAAAICEDLRIPVCPQGSCTIETGGMRIVIYAKSGTDVLPDLQKRVISPDLLPDTVVSEFVEMTKGLLSNVALRSMAVIRADTYRILKKFSTSIDAAFVTHHALKAPEGAAGDLIPLIVSEIQAVLEDHEIESFASFREIKRWFQYQMKHGLKPFPKLADCGKGGLLALIKDGPLSKSFPVDHPKVALHFERKKEYEGKVRDELTKLLTIDPPGDVNGDYELASLMSLRSRYGRPQPRLTLGTIVQAKKRGVSEYLVCILPRCDSVRIKGNRDFHFLPLKIAPQGSRFQFVVKDRGALHRLTVIDHPYAMKLVTFAADAKQGEVIGRSCKGGCFFPRKESAFTYRWVADLKFEHAQRLANDYSTKLSRVGLTESEWLRRQ